MAANPIFITNPNTKYIGLTQGITTRDGTSLTATNLVYTAGLTGSRIDRIIVSALGNIGSATTANVVRIFVSNDGTTFSLRDEVAIATATPSASAVGRVQLITYTGGLLLGPSQRLYVAMHTADTTTNKYSITVEGGDF